MRVIAGEFRSRKLKTLPGWNTRPTPDRLRESLFSVLAPRMEGASFLDAYAGTGAVGIEALSRGARRCTFIEKSRAAVETIRDNLAALGLSARAEVIAGKALTALERAGAEIVFLDPPYEMQGEYEAVMPALAAGGSGLVIVQHATRFALEPAYGRLKLQRVLKQGDNSLSFYE